MTTATIDRLYSLPSVIGTRPMGATWSADGKHLAFLWNAEGMPFRDLWMHDIACGVTERVTDLERDFAALTPAGIREVALTSAGAFLSLGDHLLRLNGAEARPVATAPGRVTQLARSPDGSALAFVAGGSLYLAEGEAPPHPLREGGERRYVESFAFAPDGRSIAAVMADDGKVREIEIAYDAGGVAHRERFTRAFPGDTGPLVRPPRGAGRDLGLRPVARRRAAFRVVERPVDQAPQRLCLRPRHRRPQPRPCRP